MTSLLIRVGLDAKEIKEFDHLAIEAKCSRPELLAEAMRLGLPKLRKQIMANEKSDNR